MAGVGVRRLDADAKYSSEKETIVAPSTEVLRFVELEKVSSIREEGTGMTVMDKSLDD